MNSVLSANVVPPAIEPESIRERYGVQMEAAVNRRLYRAAPLPIILMLSDGLGCVLLRWEQHSPSSLAWLGLLVGLSLWRILAFFRAPAKRQADPGWRFTFLVGAAVSGGRP
ncbi:hypothetical protein ACFS3C_27200 [Azotobacter vinelandii]